jgi:putative transposase
MSRKGDYWDNAVAESFFHTLKVELIYRKTYNNRQQGKTDIFEYIEVFIIGKVVINNFGYLSPEYFEKKNVT